MEASGGLAIIFLTMWMLDCSCPSVIGAFNPRLFVNRQLFPWETNLLSFEPEKVTEEDQITVSQDSNGFMCLRAGSMRAQALLPPTAAQTLTPTLYNDKNNANVLFRLQDQTALSGSSYHSTHTAVSMSILEILISKHTITILQSNDFLSLATFRYKILQRFFFLSPALFLFHPTLAFFLHSILLLLCSVLKKLKNANPRCSDAWWGES